MNSIELILMSGFGGVTGAQDRISSQYKATVKTSNFATVEQNNKMLEELICVYQTYLENVACNNGGRY